MGKGRSPCRRAQREGAAKEEGSLLPRGPARGRRGWFVPVAVGLRGRRQSGWLSRVEATDVLPSPPHVFRAGSGALTAATASVAVYLPGPARAAWEQEGRGLLMFPDRPAQPANILRGAYTFPGQREEATAGTLLTLAAEELLQPVPPGIPRPEIPIQSGLAPRSPALRKSKVAISLPSGSDWENT